MKKALFLLVSLATLAQANNYQTDPLFLLQEKVAIVSSFEEGDYLTVYSSQGTPLWEVPFASKVLSWKIDGDNLYVFSKGRPNLIYFLSCFSTQKGELLWEKPVFAPQKEAPLLEAEPQEIPESSL